LKDQARVLGVDDGPFVKGQGRVPVAGVLVCPPNYVEGVLASSCTVDGTDATEVIVDMVEGSRYREQVRMIMIDGVALGGFNVVDISLLHSRLGIPAVTVSRDRPDQSSIASALRDHFPDWDARLEIIGRHQVREVQLPDGRVYVASAGIDPKEADAMVRRCVVRGCLPEPVRLAHLVATAMVRGESHGKA